MVFLKLIRYQNVVVLVVAQLLFRYGFLEFQDISLALSDLGFVVLVLSSVCIAAGGFMINTIFAQERHDFNKDEAIIGGSISEAMAYNWYIGLNVLGVAGGFYLSNVIEKPGFALLFIIVSGTLYLYASSLKQSLLIGNFIISILAAISVIVVGLFDLFPMITPENQGHLGILFRILLDYALSAFLLNFIHEMVKDIETVDGDYNSGIKTVPVVLGRGRTSKIVLVLTAITTVYFAYYIFEYYFNNNLYLSTLYCLLTVIAPLVFFCIQLSNAKTATAFKSLRLILKVVLLFGVLSVLINSLNILYNA